MKKRWTALVLALALLAQMAVVQAGAVKNVYFTAINDNVLPVSDDTMPFWSGGYLYIPGSVFTGYVREDSGIAYTYNASKKMAALYEAGKSGRSLAFDLTKTYAQDNQGNTYYPTAIRKGDVVFVPAALVAEVFGLSYSTISLTGSNAVTGSDKGWLVWLRDADYVLQAGQFADAAKSQMSARYEQYLKSKEPSAQTPEAGQAEESFDGKSVYLCFRATEPETVSALLDALDRQNCQAAFFCTVEFLEKQGDLLRRMTATGQAVGILAEGTDGEAIRRQLEQGNAALYRATCGQSRLVYLPEADAPTAAELERQGWCCLDADIDRTGYSLRGSSNASALLQKVSSRRGDLSVWLDGDVSGAGLGAFLTAAKTAEDRCLALTEPTA